MPEVTGPRPAYVQSELDSLNVALDNVIPGKTDNNFLIATWNIKAFSSLTDKWTSGANDNPKRDLRAIHYISAILSRFDVIAIQELKGNLRALRHTLKYFDQILGLNYGFLMTDRSEGSASGYERMAYLYDADRIRPSGLAGEIVVPEEWIDRVNPDKMREQFARAPYACSFKREKQTIILVTAHIDYEGADTNQRRKELKGIAEWMKNWANRTARWHQNLIVLGDFNIDRKDDTLFKAFTSTGLKVPEILNDSYRSIFADRNSPPELGKYYDQVAWFTSGKKQKLNMKLKTGGSFDFVPLVYQQPSPLTKSRMQHRMSDHYPLWVEFEI